MHAPPFQLLGVVRRHVGKLPEDVEVRGVSWGGEQTETLIGHRSTAFTHQKHLFTQQKQPNSRRGLRRRPLSGCVTMVTTGSTSITKAAQPLCVW